MSNFNNVQIGDTVFTHKTVRYGFSSGKAFFIPAQVERMTKTQIVLSDGTRYMKDGGKRIGGEHGQAIFLEGETDNFYGDVYDQTEEKAAFIKKLCQHQSVRRMLVLPPVSVNNENLSEIHGLLKQVRYLINKGEK